MRDVFPRAKRQRTDVHGARTARQRSLQRRIKLQPVRGLKPEEKKKRGSAVCIATQKGTSANPPLIGPLYACTFDGPLFPLLPFRGCQRSHRLHPFPVFSFFFLVRHFAPRRFPDRSSSSARINVPPVESANKSREPLLPQSVRSKEAKSSDKGKMAASRSSVDEFIRLERTRGRARFRSEARRWR